MTAVHAKIRNLADETYRHTTGRVMEALFGGGDTAVQRPQVKLTAGKTCMLPDGLEVTLQAGGVLDATPRALDLPADWERFGACRAELAAGDRDITARLTVAGARCRLIREVRLVAHGQATVEIPLDDLPLTAGIHPSYRPASIRLECPQTGEHGSARVVLRSLSLVPRQGPAPACVDGFGQRRTTDWPGKVADVADLHRQRDEERAELAAMVPPADRDEFGGWTGGPRFEPGGFFRVEPDAGGRWWLVTPRGSAFWSIGVTGVRTWEVTPTRGREKLFEELPQADGPEAVAFMTDIRGKRGVNFHLWNVLRKYASVQAWRDLVIDRHLRWGFNTFANWCDEEFLLQRRVPHVRFMRTTDRWGTQSEIPMAGRRAPDVFSPAWERWVDAAMAEMVDPDNPWLIGYFIDNEMTWTRLGLLDAPPRSALRDAWEAFCRARWADLAAAGRDWGRTFADWGDLRNLDDSDVPAEGPAREAMRAFEGEYAQRYFSTIARLLKGRDPSHLYLGCRFVRALPDAAILAAAGRHVDVLSVNCYGLYPQREEFQRWHDLAGGRPMMIGEHHLPLAGPRQLPPLYEDFGPEAREDGYERYIREWAQAPFSVGSHWFQYIDQPITGRASNGENQPIGFVDVTDRPHEELVRAARKVTAHLYEWHAGAK